MATSRSMPESRRVPTHPGALLREDVLPALDLSVTEAARRLGISRQMLHDLLAERRGFSAAMALRIGKLAGNGPGLWLAMQQAYDLWHAERDLARVLAKIAPGKVRRVQDRFDVLAARVAQAYANVPQDKGMAEIDAAVQAVRHSGVREPSAPRMIVPGHERPARKAIAARAGTKVRKRHG